MPRPALGPIAVGDQVVVTDHGYRTSVTIHCAVTKVGRIWVDLEEADPSDPKWPRRYRLRLDTQDTGSQYSTRDYFRTLDRQAWDNQARAADQYLRQQGIEFTSGSRWRSEERRLTLANLLRAHDGLDPL